MTIAEAILRDGPVAAIRCGVEIGWAIYNHLNG
jgi:hypothetical protein